MDFSDKSIFPEPSNETPCIVLADCNLVAVEAFPVKSPVKAPAIVPVPVIVGEVIVGVVRVLFVKVSVVFLPINVSVEVGNVNVPVFDIEEIIGDVKVLFVNVCVEVN